MARRSRERRLAIADMNAKQPPTNGIRACVFDAYGTLFDVNSAAQQAQEILHDKWQHLAELWRTK